MKPLAGIGIQDTYSVGLIATLQQGSAMHEFATPSPGVASARPAVTATLMAETGLDENILRRLVHGFYAKVREDELLGPIFAARIADWGPHLDRMVAFWSSVALMTGRYHGRPVPAHIPLPLTWTHFERWLALFRETARETCPPAGAAHVIERAERIAQSLHFAVQDAARGPGEAPSLR
jgi:hemoglobin